MADEQLVLLFFGSIRNYKSVPNLVRAVRAMPFAELVLIVAGKPWEAAIADEVVTLAGRDSRIILSLGYVPDEEVQVYFRAADAAVLPYTDVTTSGAAMLALSFGLPVVAPAAGCILTPANPPISIRNSCIK